MKRNIFIVLILFLTLSISCQENPEDDPVIGKLPDAKPIVVHLEKKVTTDNVFAFDVFKATYNNSTEANVFISPLSISMAFNMVLNGAAGSTSDEILDALRAKDYTVDNINEHSRLLRAALTNVDPSTNFSIANSIWYRDEFPVKTSFLNVNRINYDAEVKSLDFSSPDAVTQINNWCAKQTNNKIKKIVDEIRSDVMMYLINAVYFKGIWTSKFDKSNTRQEDFYTSNGKTEKVQMMRQTENFEYVADEYGQYLELLYGNKAFSMIIALPDEDKTTDDIVKHWDNEQWNHLIESMYGALVNLRLPRFKSECEYSMHDKILPDLGMTVPFTNNADFSGISDRSLFISEVVHKTFVEVNEEGTEAAAVTSIGMMETSVGPSQPIDFIVNKPFLFAIRENSTGVILFIGKIGEIKQ
jgi:serpin B